MLIYVYRKHLKLIDLGDETMIMVHWKNEITSELKVIYYKFCAEVKKIRRRIVNKIRLCYLIVPLEVLNKLCI